MSHGDKEIMESLHINSLVMDYRQNSDISYTEEFLSDDELHFLKNLNRNEALLEYYHRI